MILFKNSAGKILTHNGKVLIKKEATATVYPNIYSEQTITLPYGDELLIGVDSNEEVVYSTDLDVETLWGNSTDRLIHWGYPASRAYVTETTPIHLYEFDMYNEQGYWQATGDGNLEADYIKEHGRYMGSVWINDDDAWVVDLVDQG